MDYGNSHLERPHAKLESEAIVGKSKMNVKGISINLRNTGMLLSDLVQV
jgi:hypothetical protein